jgi:ribonucleoside-diphosphate reductase alpha chain
MDIEIEDTHYYTLANGIVSHNSISLLSKCGKYNQYNVSSGIEPVFKNKYTRRRKINPSEEENIKVDFVDDLGDKWQEYSVFHSNIINYTEETGIEYENIQSLPEYFVEAHNVEWRNKIKLVSIIQSYIDHSISQTINLPKNTKPETVSKIYMEAWHKQLKGVTVYVEGSRDGVLISDNEQPTNIAVATKKGIKERHAPKRPKELSCDIYRSTIKGAKWTIFVGLYENSPYEVIAGLSSYLDLPKRVKSGKIIKINGPTNPKATYDLCYDFEKGPDEETVVHDIGNVFENPVHCAFSRTISLALRHGTPVQYVAEQLLKDEKESDMFSFNRVIARCLKNYIKDGEAVTIQKTCDSCGSTELIYQDGCISCICGWSKCAA